MRHSRATYDYAIRKVRRNEQTSVNGRFAEAILANHHRDLWAEVKRIKWVGQGRVAWSTIIARRRILQVSSLVNIRIISVQFDPVDMAEINNKIFNQISVNGFDGYCIVTCKDILQAIDKLNAGKSDENYDLLSDHSCDL